MIELLVKQFLYHPTALPRSAPVPAHAGDAEEVFIPVPDTDGDEIHGLYWAPDPGRPTVLFFHGNAQTVFEWALVRQDLAALACGLLLVDYPGYGKSSGAPSEEGLYRAGRAAQHWLHDDRATPASEVVLFGKSLGGGVATKLASETRFLGVILESTFCSVPAVAKGLFPWLPTDAILRTERYPSIDRIASIEAPILIVHGSNDQLIPIDQARQLHDRATPPRELYVVDGAGHNDVAPCAGEHYGQRLRAWLDATLSGRRAGHRA